jgi:N-acetyl-anhydromuramyl-L-alanine amidase AmpD
VVSRSAADDARHDDVLAASGRHFHVWSNLMNDAEAQRVLIAHGYDLGKGGPSGNGDDGHWGTKSKTACAAFQRGRGLAATGLLDAETIKALQAAMAEKRPAATREAVPPNWMPAARLERIIVHWTAGQHRASGLDKSRYHILIEGSGVLVRGTPSIAANGIGASGPRASHTLNCNTGSIGVSLCCMAGAVERPFSPGKAPMTAAQWQRLPGVLADLCRRYSILATPRTVLSHAEVQANLGIAQRGKWDIARVVPAPDLVGAQACGDAMRAAVSRLI